MDPQLTDHHLPPLIARVGISQAIALQRKNERLLFQSAWYRDDLQKLFISFSIAFGNRKYTHIRTDDTLREQVDDTAY